MRRDLFDGETLVSTWNSITLTDRRVMFNWSRGSREGVQTLSLAKVQFGAVVRTHHLWLVLIAVLLMVAAGFVALFGGAAGPIVVFVGMASVLILAYFLTRSLELQVGAGAGLVRSRVNGGKAGVKAATNFLQQLDWAVVARENEL